MSPLALGAALLLPGSLRGLRCVVGTAGTALLHASKLDIACKSLEMWGAPRQPQTALSCAPQDAVQRRPLGTPVRWCWEQPCCCQGACVDCAAPWALCCQRGSRKARRGRLPMGCARTAQLAQAAPAPSNCSATLCMNMCELVGTKSSPAVAREPAWTALRRGHCAARGVPERHGVAIS